MDRRTRHRGVVVDSRQAGADDHREATLTFSRPAIEAELTGVASNCIFGIHRIGKSRVVRHRNAERRRILGSATVLARGSVFTAVCLSVSL